MSISRESHVDLVSAVQASIGTLEVNTLEVNTLEVNTIVGDITTSGNLTLTGPVTISPNYNIAKRHDIVTFELQQAFDTRTADAFFSQAAAIPAVYRPATNQFAIVVVLDGVQSPIGIKTGQITIFPNGDVNMYAGLAAETFTGTDAGLFYPITLTWSVLNEA